MHRQNQVSKSVSKYDEILNRSNPDRQFIRQTKTSKLRQKSQDDANHRRSTSYVFTKLTNNKDEAEDETYHLLEFEAQNEDYQKDSVIEHDDSVKNEKFEQNYINVSNQDESEGNSYRHQKVYSNDTSNNQNMTAYFYKEIDRLELEVGTKKNELFQKDAEIIALKQSIEKLKSQHQKEIDMLKCEIKEANGKYQNQAKETHACKKELIYAIKIIDELSSRSDKIKSYNQDLTFRLE